ncbi:MAG: sugar ABC transporter permease [Mesorhizobium sp.]|nr:MAG: sugar ABC transporter permease [Mesorhizobium sp.]
MATQQTRSLARFMMAPSVILLFVWMIVPLAFTLWFSFLQYNPLNPIRDGFVWFSNYKLFYSNPAFFAAILNTLTIVVSVLVITVVGGILLAMLIDQPMWGQGIVRIFGGQPIDWFGQHPLTAVIIIVAWQWLPFATLILLTSLQSLDGEQKEAAEMDGAGFLSRFIYLTLPHMSRAITVVILIQTIFLLSVYAEILVTTNGGPGYASTNLPFLVYQKALLEFKIGQASAGGVIAVILANIVAFFAMRAVGKNLDK